MASRQQTAPRYLRDHTNSVFGLAYSPNGKQLATAAADRTVKVWDTNSGKRLFTLSESTADEYAVAYRPDGRQLAAGGVDKTLRVWNVDARGGTLARSAFAHDGAILKVLYSHDGKSLFTCGEDNTAREWDADTLAERAPYPKQPDWPQSLALSPNDKLLAVGRHDGTLALYDTGSHRPISVGAVSGLRPGHMGRIGPMGRMGPVTATDRAGSPACRATTSPSRRADAIRSTWRPVTIALRPHNSPSHPLTPSPAHPRPPPDVDLKQQPGNEKAATAQPVTVPCVVSGVLWSGKPDAAAPKHFYRFPAKKGEKLLLDVMARRAGSPLNWRSRSWTRRGSRSSGRCCARSARPN